MGRGMKIKLKKYTAFVPKTLKATKNIGKSTMKKFKYFLSNTTSTLKRTTKMLDKRAAKSIRSLTKRRHR
jgi:hypothetical protein